MRNVATHYRGAGTGGGGGGGGGGSSATVAGWSGPDIPGATNKVMGSWMARVTWDNLRNGDWLPYTTLPAYVAANPSYALDLGVPLIPHDSGNPYDTELNAAIAGSHDADYTGMGASIASMGPATVYARVWWEFNMYSAGFTASKFVAAWQRAVPLIRAGFASAADPGQELKIVWCYLTANNNPLPCWPGGGYVDVVSSDVYGKVWSGTNPSQAQMLSEVASQLNELSGYGATYGKPVSLGEWANVAAKPGTEVGVRGCGDCPDYIDLVFDWAEANNTTHIVYYNIAEGGVDEDMSDIPLSLARYQVRSAAL